MQKVKFLILLVIASLVCSCESDDENDTIGDAALLIGSWTYQSYFYEMTINGTDYIDYINEAYGDVLNEEQLDELIDLYSQEIDYPLTITFNTNGTYTIVIEGDTTSGTYILTGDQLVTDSGTQEEVTQTVYNLTNSELTFGTEQEYEEDIDLDDENDIFKSKFTISLTKN